MSNTDAERVAAWMAWLEGREKAPPPPAVDQLLLDEMIRMEERFQVILDNLRRARRALEILERILEEEEDGDG